MATEQTTAILRPADFNTEYLTINGIKMHVALEGPVGGPLVVLLHGFPEFWYSWRWQIKALAAAGFRVVAPDQRGYNLTDKTGPYDPFQLTDDVMALITTLGYEKAAAVIGHDWGGVVTWVFGARYPAQTERLIVCNVPHLSTMKDVLRERNFDQLTKSWYMFFFQLPGLPEQMLAPNDHKTLAVQLYKQTKGTVSREEIGYFQEAWRQPGAIQGGINWYRALFRTRARLEKTDLQVHVPSLLIWGEDDSFLTKRTAELTRLYVDNLTIHYLPGISHWVQQQAADQVNRGILGFLAQPTSQPAAAS
jgi:pimeloyl-ACP methyl ester carboxylesterase